MIQIKYHQKCPQLIQFIPTLARLYDRCQYQSGDQKLHLPPRYDKPALRAPNNKKIEDSFHSLYFCKK